MSKKAARPTMRPQDPQVPAVRLQTIRAADGALLRRATAQRAAWRDPDDSNVRARVPKLVSGYKRYDALERLAKRAGNIRAEHVRAAERFAQDYEATQLSRGRALDLTCIKTAFGPRDLLDPRRAGAQRRYQQTCQVLGKTAVSIVEAIVLYNEDVKAYATRRGVDAKVAMGLLVAALDRLVEHYGKDTLKPTVFETGVGGSKI